jgi:hypothetical protein
VETVVGRSLELRIAARTVSRQALRVVLLPPASVGHTGGPQVRD